MVAAGSMKRRSRSSSATRTGGRRTRVAKAKGGVGQHPRRTIGHRQRSVVSVDGRMFEQAGGRQAAPSISTLLRQTMDWSARWHCARRRGRLEQLRSLDAARARASDEFIGDYLAREWPLCPLRRVFRIEGTACIVQQHRRRHSPSSECRCCRARGARQRDCCSRDERTYPPLCRRTQAEHRAISGGRVAE